MQSGGNNNANLTREETTEGKDQVSKSYFPKNMISTSGTGVEIRKFDGKNFALWKEMIWDVLIIRHQIKAIRHKTKLASLTTDK